MRVSPPGVEVTRRSVPHAGALFTDRDSDSDAFRTTLSVFRQLLDADTDTGVARRNILVFHGVAGIGKTTLSERLEFWANGGLGQDDSWGPAPRTKIAATVRIDLHGSEGQVDIAAALIALRSNVAHIKPRWPTFDLAFAAYWSAVRRGETLPTFGGRDELGNAVADTVGDVLGDLASVAGLVATGTGTSLGIRAIRYLIGELRRRHDMRLTLQAFDGYEAFLMRCADEPGPSNPKFGLACEIAGTLSWELSRLSPCPLVVVFIDAAERLTLDLRRTAESYVNNLIYRMPNVLFVVTGRNRLDWYDEGRSDLPYRGPWTWPGLMPTTHEEPGQHLIGNLSPDDARTVIVRGRDQLDLPISDHVIDKLVTASAGLPQYLELARQVAISIKSAGGGRQVTTADVTGSMRSLVNRVLDDVPSDEQRVIRAAALFRTFNLDLVSAAADVDHGCAERAVQRSMIDNYPDERFPYRMHDAIRSAIRNTDHQVAGGWSGHDWQLASSRAAAAAHRLHDEAKKAEANRDVLDALGIAIGLTCDQETALESLGSPNYADWLTRAIVFAPSVQALRPRIPASSTTQYGQRVIDFVIAKSIDTPIDERIQLLRAIFDSAHPLRLPGGRHLGYTLKLQHRWDEALRVFDEVVGLAPTDLNVGQRPQVLSLARRFTDAEAAARGTTTAALIRRVGEYAHGRPERYFDEIGEMTSKLRKAGRQREYLEERGTLLVRLALFRGEDLLQAEIEAFRDEAEQAGHVIATRSALLATALQRVTDESDRAVALQRLKALDEASGSGGAIGFRYALGEVCDALISGNSARITALQIDMQHVDFRTRSWIPVECFFDVLGIPLGHVPTQWLEPYEMVRQRWRGHLVRYLARHGSAVELRDPK